MCPRVISLLLVLIVINGIMAKSGCSLYGHSCYGGNGKRANLMDSGTSKDNSVADLERPLYVWRESSGSLDNANLPVKSFRLSKGLADEQQQQQQINKFMKILVSNYLKQLNSEELDN
ncbi:hypothetical protein ABEB36_004488 [Hypothenemus hampei]|uniref:Uncharacterized protein n=1 Tax=Hypothenemus hampei TaxID=57062 RepID=A0ABD1F3H9_HYPHA